MSDSFRSPIGSAAISILLAYLASCPDMKDSDVERVRWCQDQLERWKFIYGDAKGDKPKVIEFFGRRSRADMYSITAMAPSLPVWLNRSGICRLSYRNQESSVALGHVPKFRRSQHVSPGASACARIGYSGYGAGLEIGRRPQDYSRINLS